MSIDISRFIHARITRRTAITSALTAMLAIIPVAGQAPVANAAPMRTTLVQRDHAADAAQRKVGARYVWGAAGPRTFDCSGLVSWAYRSAHHNLRVRTTYQMWRLGRHVTRKQLRRGDLVYTWDRNYGHVGLFLGRNRYVHAPGTGRRVIIAPLPGRGGYFGAVRP